MLWTPVRSWATKRGLIAGLWLAACMIAATGAGCSAIDRSPMAVVFPTGLVPGDTIAFVAPAGKLDRKRMELAEQRLEAMGFEVRVPEDLYRTRGSLAGEDAVRAAELMAAFRDPQVKAIFPGTGGFGTTRMLDRLDYDLIRRNPKIFIGFSDITGLHLALQCKTGLVTFHSPNPMYGLGSEGNLRDFSAKYFWRALLQREHVGADGNELPPGYAYDIPAEAPQIEVISPGVGRGRLTGGNLSLIIALMGTEYEIRTDGRVLFLEDIGERPYRIDRCLAQLRLAGKLDKLAGVILGQFTDCKPKEGKDSLSLEQVFRDYFADLGVPVIANFPAGHSRYNATLPLGVLVEVDADRGRVTVLDEPIRIPDSP
ncbi:MAG: LD-carboxypeptidase [bacterium]|nr:LD-carboxypeptidase [bacterium]